MVQGRGSRAPSRDCPSGHLLRHLVLILEPTSGRGSRSSRILKRPPDPPMQGGSTPVALQAGGRRPRRDVLRVCGLHPGRQRDHQPEKGLVEPRGTLEVVAGPVEREGHPGMGTLRSRAVMGSGSAEWGPRVTTNREGQRELLGPGFDVALSLVGLWRSPRTRLTASGRFRRSGQETVQR